MRWYILAAEVPDGTQLFAVGATSKAEAIREGVVEIKKHNNLPTNYTVLPRYLNDVEGEEKAKEYIKVLHDKLIEVLNGE